MPPTSTDFNATYDTALPTLTESGKPPVSRVTSADQVRNLCQAWMRNDQWRAEKRARVTGLIEGNPPYRATDLRNAGRADACNVNWRMAEAYEEAAKGAFYDVFSEAPTFASIDMPQRPEDTINRSSVVTYAFHRLLKKNASWDMTMQGSIQEMVRFGAGPVMFEDDTDYRPRSVQFQYLQVPDGASCDVNKWECAAVRIDYLAHQLYEFIRDPEAAETMGWNIEATRKAIMEAYPETEGGTGNIQMNWEWHQEQLKLNTYSYSAKSRTIRVFHFFAKEFPEGNDGGRITHAIVLMDVVQGTDTNQFLYKKDRRFSNWRECIHPMYYAYGSNGKHYGVTGMGVKMYGAIECQNRLLCNTYDKVFAPKIMFKPTTASGKQKFLMTRMGDYGVLPEGYDSVQVGLQGLIEEALAFNRQVENIVSTNLSSYRQNLQQKDGNPITASEVEYRASEQAKLGKTQLNRYYEQLDWLYQEMYRRASNPAITETDPGGQDILEFQAYCAAYGIMPEELRSASCVKATRIVGQGSSYMRQQTLDFLLQLSGTLPEDGRVNLIKDVVASRAGQELVNRYYPPETPNKLASDQEAFATSQVADMKIGVPAVVTSSQNPLIYAETFLKAAAQALGSLEQGADPREVYSFLEMVGPAIAAHVQRLEQDPTRQQAAKVLGEQLKEIAAATDQLGKRIQQDAQEQQQAQQMSAKMQMEAAAAQQKMQIDAAKAQQQMALKQQKTQVDMALKQRKTQQGMALSDAKTASDIFRRNRAEQQAAEEENDSE